MSSQNSQAICNDRVNEVYDFIEKQKTRRQSNKVLHAHPSPLFWHERNVPIKEIMIQRMKAKASIHKKLNVYIGTPYCLPTNPERCGYCLFPSEVFQGQHQLEVYLKYLESEGRKYQEFFEGEELASLYFGGGTSNLYKPDDYHRLLMIVRGVFPILPQGIEITLEGVPQLFTWEKLTAMKAAGINRISLGVQQLDDNLIKLSGRKQKASHTLQALAWCQELGLRSSVDMIFGWPRQTIKGMLKDLEAIVRTGVRHITHYELNVAGRSHFARYHKEDLPSIEQNLEMYHVAKEFLESQEYRQVTAYDWEHTTTGDSGAYRFEENMRTPFAFDADGVMIGYDMWGWGFAGVSYFAGTPERPGWTYMNCAGLREYFGRLDEDRFPIERGFHYSQRDLRIAWLFQTLQGMSVGLNDYERIFGVDLLEEYSDIWQALSARGWVDISNEQITLVGDGVFYTPLIQGLLAHARMEEMRKGKSEHVLTHTATPESGQPSATLDYSPELPVTASRMAVVTTSISNDPHRTVTELRIPGKPQYYQERTMDGTTLSLIRIAGQIQHETPVILTHGTFSNAQVCTRLAGYLADMGFDCWILELRGHGRSESGPVQPDFERFSEFDVPAGLEAVRRRTGMEQIFWVGHSGGGLVLLMHLARNQEAGKQIRGLVTLASQATDAGLTAMNRLTIALSAIGNNLIRYAPGPLLKLGPENEWRGVMNQWFRWNWNGRWTGKDGFDYISALERIDVPALCFAGGGDRFIAPYSGCRRLYNALGSLDKRMVLCARSEGYEEDYSHARIIVSRPAQREIWPIISEWLVKRT